MTDARNSPSGEERRDSAGEPARAKSYDPDPASTSPRSDDCGQDRGWLGACGSGSKRAGRTAHRHVAPSPGDAKGCPETWGSMMAAKGRPGPVFSCCSAPPAERAAHSLAVESAAVSANRGNDLDQPTDR